MRRVGSGLFAALLVAVAAHAETLAPLPEPLTLADAIQLARPDLPAVELAAAAVDEGQAALSAAESLSGARLSAIGTLRVIDPSANADDREANDSHARLALRKRLYDFGYSQALQTAARESGAGNELRHLRARQQSQLDIMRAFFDVILADLQFARDNEAMAGAFIDFDRAQDRHELERISDVELLRLEAEYQRALLVRTDSAAMQRAARSRLAVVMGRPDDLVSDLVRPAAPDIDVELPDYQVLLQEVLQKDPELGALRAEVSAAQAAVSAARSENGPVLTGQIDAAAYNRETSSRHPLSAALVLEIPILTGGARDANIADARAKLRRSRAALRAREYSLRQQVLEHWQKLSSLRTQLKGLAVRGDYRELYLDRSRALYELEVKTDLGDAMTETSAVRLEVAAAEFEWLMTEARLAALAGQLLEEEP